MTVKSSFEELRRTLDERFEKRSPTTYGVVTGIVRDGNNSITGVTATIDNVEGQSVNVPYGVPLNTGAQIEVRLAQGEVVAPEYHLVRVVQNNLVVQLDTSFGDVPSPQFVPSASWTTDIYQMANGGPVSGMKARVTAQFLALNYIYYKVSHYVLQCKKSTSNAWELTHQIPAANYTEGAVISYTFDGLEITTSYDFQVAAQTVSPDQISAWGNTSKTTAGDTLAPAVPNVASLSSQSIPGAIVLNWSNNLENDLAGYLIYYRNANSGWVRLSDNANSHTDYIQTTTANLTFATNFSASTNWYFRITAVDTSGNESAFTTTLGPYAPAQSGTVGAAPSITANPSLVTLSWTPYTVNAAQFGRLSLSFPQATYSTNSISYTFRWRSSTDSGTDNSASQPWQYVAIENPSVVSGTITQTFQNMIPSRFYSVQAQAVDPNGRSSDWTPEKSLTATQTTFDTTAPAEVTGLTCAGESGGDGAFHTSNLELLWDANSEADLAGYRVEIHKLALVPGAVSPQVGTLVQSYVVGASVATGKPTFTYTYPMNERDFNNLASPTVTVRVIAFDSANNASLGVASSCWKTFTNPAPTAITGLADSVAMFRSITFLWNQTTDPDFAYYELTLDSATSNNGLSGFATIFENRTASDNSFTYRGEGALFYRLTVSAVDVFGQSSPTTLSAWIECAFAATIQPEDLAGRAYQITPTASAGITAADGVTTATATDLGKLFDYNTTTAAVVNPTASWRYVQYEFPVQHTFNKTQVSWSVGTATVYVGYSTDNVTWNFLSGNGSNQLTGSASDTLTSVSTNETTARTQAVTFVGSSGTKHLRWPTMVQAKYLRLYVGAIVTLTEVKQETYVVADTIDAGTINLAKGISLYDDVNNVGFQITKDKASFWNSSIEISSSTSGSTSSRIEIAGNSIRAYNGNTKTVEILGSDGTNPGSVWAKKGGFGGTALSDSTIKLDGATGAVSINGNLSVGTGGAVSSGAAGYNAGTGFWFDHNSGTPRLFIGNSAGNKMTWDGSSLTVKGTVNADAGYLGALDVSGTLTVTGSGKLVGGGGNTTVDTSGITLVPQTTDNYTSTTTSGSRITLLTDAYLGGATTASGVHSSLNLVCATGSTNNHVYLQAGAANIAGYVTLEVHNGTGVTIGKGSGASATLSVGDNVKIGTNPALSGILAISNNQWVAARNNANSADVNILKVNSSNAIEFGSAPKVGSDLVWTDGNTDGKATSRKVSLTGASASGSGITTTFTATTLTKILETTITTDVASVLELCGDVGFDVVTGGDILTMLINVSTGGAAAVEVGRQDRKVQTGYRDTLHVHRFLNVAAGTHTVKLAMVWNSASKQATLLDDDRWTHLHVWARSQ